MQAVDAPFNMAAGAGMPNMTELADLGVARVSTASRLATMALGVVDQAVRAILATGRFDSLIADFTYADANGCSFRTECLA